MRKNRHMKAILFISLVVFIITALGFSSSFAAEPFCIKQKVLVIAPHEDDESISCAGVIKKAIDNGVDVRVMYVSNGDSTYQPQIRAQEAITAMSRLGVNKSKLYYLSYGAWSVLDGLYYSKDYPSMVLCSIPGNIETYGFPGIIEDYHFLTTGSHASYCRQNVLSDIQDVIDKFRPDDIYMPSPFERDSDHKATALFTIEAVLNIKKNDNYRPVIHEYQVYKYGLPQNYINYYFPPVLYTNVDANMDFTSPYNWADRESIPVPFEMSSAQTYNKYINLAYEGAQIIADGSSAPYNDISMAFDNNVFSSYVSNIKKGNTTITVTFPNPEMLDGINVLTGETYPASTFITVEAADNPEDLFHKTRSYKSLVQNLESKFSDWQPIRAGNAYNLKVWRFTFHANMDESSVNVREIDFYTGNLKGETLRDYISQFGIEKWAMADEIFWKKKMSSLSYNATVNVSSENNEKQQYGKSVIDGVVLGDGIFKYRYDAYAQDPTRTFNDLQNRKNMPFEWVTQGEADGAWAQLTWQNPITANRIVLYDRPDLDENILKAKLTFSDGSHIKVGPLNKNGSATVIDFEKKTFSWVNLKVQEAEGCNAGLAEFEVYDVD